MAYTTKAMCKGGREGRAMLDGGALALSMAFPKELGGAGDGHNPEQLFAIGYASCFNQAVIALAKNHGLNGQDAKVSCQVTLEKDDTSFQLSVELGLAVPGGDKAAIEALLQDAHRICPYSRATRGNIAVTLKAL
jgi:Ohr subfamily peroxiredoxin